MLSPHTNSIVELLKGICKRPEMYIGDKKISSLRSYLDGFNYALFLNCIREEDVIPFRYFHEFVSRHYNWKESTAGWCNIILEENKNDEEKSLDVFFELFEQFANIKILSTQNIKLNEQHKAFHNYTFKCIAESYTEQVVSIHYKRSYYKCNNRIITSI